MSLWGQISHGLRVLLKRRDADQELSDELQHYFDEAVAEGVARGWSQEEARRVARAECGNLTNRREEVRSAGWEHVIDTAVADVRYAMRRLRASGGFTSVSVLTLAIGIGATTAIFSAVYAILFKPLPYPHPDRLLMISDVGPGTALSEPTFGTYEELVQRTRSFDALAATNAWAPALTGSGAPQRVAAEQVSAPFFRVWGIAPAQGRDFVSGEDVFNGPRVAILSARLATRQFGTEQSAVGKAVTLDGDPYTVIGVMPARFENELAPSADVWVPLQYRPHAPPETREWGHHIHIIGRLRPGLTADQGRRELEAIARMPIAAFPRPAWAALSNGLIVHGLQQDVTSDARPALLAILGAVFLVLAIAGVNVTNLLLARGVRRRGEFAMRIALGAGRARLVRQLLTESVILALIGGVVGFALAVIGVRAIIALSPPGLPRVDTIRLDSATFVFALAITSIVGITIGLAPALTAARHDLHTALHEGSRRTGGSHHTARRGLVVAEVALALVLLVSAGLLVRSLGRLLSVASGFDPSHVITMQVLAAGHQYDSDDARFRFYSDALETVRGVPGVIGAAFTSQLPLSGDHDGYGVTVQSHPTDTLDAARYVVTPGYLETMRIPLLRGRLFNEHDDRQSPEVLLISESFAKREFPGEDPVGQHMKAGPDFDNPKRAWGTIIGVVGNVKQDSLAIGDPDAFYMPMGQWDWVDTQQSLVVRASGDAVTLVPTLERAIWSIDKDPPITRVATMEALVAGSTSDRRFVLTLFEAFSAVALILAAVGIYGVLSGSVSERTREIGVRSALGASRTAILSLIGRDGMRLTALGVLIGLVGAFAASRAIAALLFDITPIDPITYVGMVSLLAAVAALACWLPAWRATRVDPSHTLRLE